MNLKKDLYKFKDYPPQIRQPTEGLGDGQNTMVNGMEN